MAVVGRRAQAPVLQMRAPSARQPGPVFEHRAGSGWVRVATLRAGSDVSQATASAFGDWALVRLTHPRGAGAGGRGGGVNAGLLAAGVAALAVAGLILAVRVTRTRRGSAKA